jgi:hypothetical protein
MSVQEVEKSAIRQKLEVRIQKFDKSGPSIIRRADSRRIAAFSPAMREGPYTLFSSFSRPNSGDYAIPKGYRGWRMT